MSEKIVQLNEEVITSSRKSLCEEAQKCRIFFCMLKRMSRYKLLRYSVISDSVWSEFVMLWKTAKTIIWRFFFSLYALIAQAYRKKANKKAGWARLHLRHSPQNIKLSHTRAILCNKKKSSQAINLTGFSGSGNVIRTHDTSGMKNQNWK